MIRTLNFRAGVALLATVLALPGVAGADDGAEAIQLELRDVAIERADGLVAHARRVTALTDGPVQAFGLRFSAPVEATTVTGSATRAAGEAAGETWRIDRPVIRIRNAVVSAAWAWYDTAQSRLTLLDGARFEEAGSFATGSRAVVIVPDERVVLRGDVRGTIRP